MAIPTIIVRPKTPLVPEIIKLSLIDQFTIRAYTPALVFFKPTPKASYEGILSDLEQSLGGVLNEMPFLAGNVVTEDVARDTLQIEIPDDAGVNLKVREYMDGKKGPVFDFDELQKSWFPSSPLDPDLLCPRHYFPDRCSPVLDLQINFIVGGVVLAIYTHHSVMDGAAISILIRTWSEHITAVSEGRIVQRKEYTPPGSLLQSIDFQGTANHHLTEFPGFKASWSSREDAPVSISDIELSNPSIPPILLPSPNLTFGYWYISKAKLHQLEDSAKPSNPTSRLMTWSTIFSAFIWRHYSLARHLHLRREIQEIAFFTPVDARSRMDPPLPSDYPCNAIVHARAALPPSELFSTDKDAIYRIASAINASIESWTADRITALLGAMDAWPGSIRDVERGMDVTCKRDLEITNSSGLQLYTSHWGASLGTPCAFRLPGIYVLDGQVNMLPRLKNGGLEFVTYMNIEALEELKRDRNFAKFAEFKCA